MRYQRWVVISRNWLFQCSQPDWFCQLFQRGQNQSGWEHWNKIKFCGYQNWWCMLSKRWDHRKSNILGRIKCQVILERLSWWPSEYPTIIWEVSGIGLDIINLHKWQYNLINHTDRRSSCWEIQELLIEIEAHAWTILPMMLQFSVVEPHLDIWSHLTCYNIQSSPFPFLSREIKHLQTHTPLWVSLQTSKEFGQYLLLPFSQHSFSSQPTHQEYFYLHHNCLP